MPKKAHSTQKIVNAFPPWSNIRVDEQSLGFQFANVVGGFLDDLRKQNVDIGSNYYLPTSIVSDIDVYYRAQLPRTFEFTVDDDDSELLFTAPTVSGFVDDVAYAVSLTEDNNVENFWYTAIPDRIGAGSTASGAYLVASGYAFQSPLSPLIAGEFDVPNHLWVTISGGTSYIGFENNMARRGLVHITGTTRAGDNTTEELIFLHDDILRTVREFKEVEQVDVFGIDDSQEAFVSVAAANFLAKDYKSAYTLDVTLDKEESPSFWGIGPGAFAGQYVLNYIKYDTGALDLRMDGFITKNTILQVELLDSNGDNIVPRDLTIEPYSDRIWIVDTDTLYVYSADLPYPATTSLVNKNYDASAVIEPSNYYIVASGQVQLDYVWRRPTTGLVQHRVWVEKPDGNKYSIESGAEITYHTDNTSWDFGEPTSRLLRPSDRFTLIQRGNYIYNLETNYTDGTTSIDQRIVSVVYKEPEAQYSLTPIVGSNTITGVDFDSECKLWVLDTNGLRYEVNRHYDIMLADITKKILYFREPYDQVRVY
jgi:hypothetical protein